MRRAQLLGFGFVWLISVIAAYGFGNLSYHEIRMGKDLILKQKGEEVRILRLLGAEPHPPSEPLALYEDPSGFEYVCGTVRRDRGNTFVEEYGKPHRLLFGAPPDYPLVGALKEK